MSNTKEIMQIAKGSFEVKLTPVGEQEVFPTQMTIDKTFAGDITATSQGLMISKMTTVKGSAGYVALEEVTGELAHKDGVVKRGSFVLQHSGSMNKGVQSLNITVIADSATGELEGLSGSMKIIINDKGEHFYEFEYIFSE